MRRDALFLNDIVEAADAVAAFLATVDREQFLASEMVRSAVVWKLVIIGEAAHRLSEESRALAPNVRWGSMVGFRNFVVHGYYDADWAIVWETATLEVPVLRAHMVALLADLPDSG